MCGDIHWCEDRNPEFVQTLGLEHELGKEVMLELAPVVCQVWPFSYSQFLDYFSSFKKNKNKNLTLFFWL